VVNVDMSGDIKDLRVNGVDVVPLMEAELDRRYPVILKSFAGTYTPRMITTRRGGGSATARRRAGEWWARCWCRSRTPLNSADTPAASGPRRAGHGRLPGLSGLRAGQRVPVPAFSRPPDRP